VKLLQLNAWGGRLEPQIGDILKSEQPDIICLQEAISFEGEGTGLFITIENIQKIAGLDYTALGPVFSFSYMKGTARFGNCILSRYPINKTEVVFTHLEHKDDFMWGEDSANVRNFVHSVLDINGKACNVLTHHGFHVPDHKNGNEETEAQTRLIANYIRDLQGPVILTGDFNLVPKSKSIEQLNAVLKNLSLEKNLKTTRTHLTYKTEVCDYIFVNNEVTVTGFEALEKVVSDHQALVLDFEL